jgi:hypothetical protein
MALIASQKSITTDLPERPYCLAPVSNYLTVGERVMIHNSCASHFRLKHTVFIKQACAKVSRPALCAVSGRLSYPICSPSVGVFYLGAVYAAHSPSLWIGVPEALLVEQNDELKTWPTTQIPVGI